MDNNTHHPDIPEHLHPFIMEQNPDLYTAIDHTTWRFIMRISKAFYKKHAHPKYLDGLKETGISTDRIPLISEMDECLKKFGWRAVGVSGFIPPAVFMEFQSLSILPIACEMRKVENLIYTPAPDIVHEAAGHAPIISDPAYSKFLKHYGSINKKAIYSKGDVDVYEGIRNLSEVKEDPHSTPEQIEEAQNQLSQAVSSVEYVSEATYLARMAWWTTEYGLVGDLSQPLIYGAGLLSSVGEGQDCFKEKVLKLPFTLDALNMSYDITRPQPQLFVARDFASLSQILEEYADTMAFRTGGVNALAKAKAAQATTSTVLDSGIQIGGVLANFIVDETGTPCYLQYKGPTQLAFDHQIIDGHDSRYHSEGFGTPVGRLEGTGKTPAELTNHDLQKGKRTSLAFQSGVKVEGNYRNQVSKNGVNLILTFDDCLVTKGDVVLFQPEWGTYDLACGTQVTSVFGGAPDRVSYIRNTGEYKNYRTKKQFSNLTDSNRKTTELYARLRRVRIEAEEKGALSTDAIEELESVMTELDECDSQDWLLSLEFVELCKIYQMKSKWEPLARKRIEAIRKTSQALDRIIERGFALFESSEELSK